MSSLFGNNISQTYQGLIKLADSTTGVTSTTQSLQDGLGNNIPIQVSNNTVNISGSFLVNGQPISVDTGSLVTKTEFNSYTSSVDLRFDGIELETGSLQNQINGLATTGSLSGYTTVTTFNNYTGSNDAKVNELISKTGSYATITGQTALSSSIASTDLSQNNRLTALESVTGSINRNGLITTGSIGGVQSITGSLNVEGTITATSASFTYVNTVYETASVIYSSGSNQLGDASNDTQTLWGTVNLPSGPLVITGSVTSTGGFNGNLNGTASFATSASYTVSSSFATNAATASIANDLIVVGKNNNSSTLTRGTIVRIVGANGDNPLFDSASWTDDFNSANTLGMLSEDVVSNGFANVVVQGKVIGINTNGMTAGALLFLSSSGQYTTSSVPAPFHEVRLGQVLRSNVNNGSAYISVDNGYELSELHDVDIINPVNGDLLVYRSGSYGQWVNETGGELGYATTGSNNFVGNQTITGSLILSGSAGPELDVKGDVLITGSINVQGTNILQFGGSTGGQINQSAGGNLQINPKSGNKVQIDGNTEITGSASITGSLNVFGNSSLSTITPSTFKQNLTIISDRNAVTSSTVLNNYLNAITTSLSDSETNLGFIPGRSILPGGISTHTGSVFISGSNNLILSLGSSLPAVTGRRVVYGTGNIGLNGPTINTSSLYVPQINNNYQAGTLAITIATGSSSNLHSFGSNVNLGNLTWNHPSASISQAISSQVTSNVIVGTIASSTAGPTFLTASSTLQNNIISNGNLALQNVSSSIQTTNNIIGGTNTTITNRYFTTGSNNFLAVATNIIGGQGMTIAAAGSPATNVSRTLVGNILGGQAVAVSLEANNTDSGGLRNSIAVGYGLTVSGSHSAAVTSNQGAAYFGRFNSEDNGLADVSRTVFAVGTGTAFGNRRSGLYVTSGSLVGVSGSMLVQGNTSIAGLTNVLTVTGSQTIQHSIAGQPALTVIAQGTGQPSLTVTGSLNVTGTLDHTIFGNSLSISGSVNVRNVMNLTPLNPLPIGTIGDLAVSGSNLFFYNGAWTQIV